MAKLPTFRRLYKGDFAKEDQPLIEKMSLTVNNGTEVIYNALNANLSLQDNMLGTYTTLTLKVDSTGAPTPKGSITFTIGANTKIIGLQVLSVTNTTNPNVYPTSGVFISFTQSGNSINVNNITGLIPGNTYSINVFAHGQNINSSSSG